MKAAGIPLSASGHKTSFAKSAARGDVRNADAAASICNASIVPYMFQMGSRNAGQIMAQDKSPRRRKILRFTAPRRAAFLEFYRGSGNWTAAAEAVGIDRSTADQRRKRDAQFALDCLAAQAEADRRLAGAEGAFDAPGQGDFSVIKRSRRGRTQIIRAGAKRWSKKVEERFFAALATCGNVAAAARAVGFTEGCIWTRRREWPAFRRRMEEVLDDAELRIEFRLAATGCDVAAAAGEDAEGRPSTLRPGSGEPVLGTNEDKAAEGACDSPPEAAPFDPEFGLRFLKWREEKRRGRGAQGRPVQRVTLSELDESLRKKLAILNRRDAERKHAEGWTLDEAAECWIPPGWVRGGDEGDARKTGDGDDGDIG
jgi:hypothetical protein